MYKLVDNVVPHWNPHPIPSILFHLISLPLDSFSAEEVRVLWWTAYGKNGKLLANGKDFYYLYMYM